jgi:Flp pilus assembly protein TadG
MHRSPSIQRHSNIRSLRGQQGVVAIEFALVFLFGVLPLLLLTFSGVMIFAAQQTLTLAAAEGARAALQALVARCLALRNNRPARDQCLQCGASVHAMATDFFG